MMNMKRGYTKFVAILFIFIIAMPSMPSPHIDLRSRILFRKYSVATSPLPNDDNDTLDQHQDWGNAKFALIYGDRWYAQSFIPGHADILTRVKICIKKLEKKLSYNEPQNSRFSLFKKILFNRFSFFKKISFNGRISSLFSRSSSKVSSLSASSYKYNPNPKPRKNKPGNLIVSIRSDLYGDDLATASISYDALEKDKVEWIEFDFPDIDESDYIYSKPLYIVVHTTGGDSENCYAWLYDDSLNRYENGSKYSSYSGGHEWYQDGKNEDFCFRTYGKDKPADGIVERWALLVGVGKIKGERFAWYADNDALDMRETLHELNPEQWPEDHFYVLINDNCTLTNIYKGFHWLDKMEDRDDILLLMFCSHAGGNGGISTVPEKGKWKDFLDPSDMDRELDKMGSRAVTVIIRACGSGRAISNESKLPSDGRVILTAANATGLSYANTGLEHGVFPYYLMQAFSGKGDFNKDGTVSAEEAFKYAYPRSVAKTFNAPNGPQRPCISDGYPTLENNKEELPIVTYR